jgi:hypothetical protein
MAQQIKLKRSAIAGKVPSTGSLSTGELAINTVDGKVYFKRDDDTIQTIVTTNAVITGSLNINGPVTASFFKGNGSAITGVVSSSYTATASYVNPLDQTVQVTGGISASQDSYFNLIKIGRPANQSAGNLTSLAIGHQTLGSNAMPNPGSIAIGYQALRNSTAGYLNVAVGNNALDSLTSGSSNTAVGHTALGGLDNIGASEFNAWNSALGRHSLQTLNMGGYNAGLGAYAGYYLYSGSNNVLLGYRAGGTAQYSSDSVFIGTGAGPIGGLVTVSNKLYIHNTGSNQPLLYGEFDNQLLKVYGDLHVSESLTVTGSLNTNGSITGSDVRIDQWGSVSASLSSVSSQAAVVPTLQQVTTQGNTTTTSITAASFTGSLFGTASLALNALSSSYALSASYALTASHAANLTISGSIANVNYIDFNTGSATPAWKSGRVFWDNTDGALSVYNAEADITLQVGQENWTRVFNASGVLIQDGTPVRLVGSHGDVPEIQLAQAIAVSGSVETSNQILGLATHDIEINTIGYVTTEGLVKGLNTNAFSDGDRLFVSSSAGKLTKVAPPAPYEVIPVGIVVKAGPGGSGIIYVTTEQPKDFADLSSVRVEGAYTHGDLLIYSGSGTGGVWRHTRNLIGAYQLTGSLGINGTLTGNLTGNASTATTASYALKAESVGQLNQNVVINGNLQVFGTSSLTYVTSSQLNVAASFISVNIFEPAERFGGLKVYDSGSLSHQATASLAWDSLHNHWVYQNVSGSTYTGGMLLAGPRNTGSLGDEPNLTKWFVPRSDGGDHLNDSQIFTSGSTTIITGSLTTTGKVNINTVDNFGSDPDKFLALTGAEVVYRTGAQLLSDIGGQTAGTFVQNAGSGGVARYIMRYEDSNSATTSSIYEDTSGNIGIKKITPSAAIDVNGSAIVSGSLTIQGTTAVVQQGILVSGTTSLTVTSISTGSYEGAFLDYVIASGSNKRAGTLATVWTPLDIEWNDVSTLDLGSTVGAEFTPTLAGSNANLILAVPAGTWTVKGHLRYM